MRRFEAYEDEGGGWRWRLWGANGTIIASSGEAFASQASALRAAEGVRAAAGAAEVSAEPGLGIAAARRLRSLLSDDEVPAPARRARQSNLALAAVNAARPPRLRLTLAGAGYSSASVAVSAPACTRSSS